MGKKSSVKENSEHVSVSPSPAALVESMRSIGYTLETALADIVDNSISAGATEISIRFSWAESNPWVCVSDNGCGMDAEELRNAMRFGSRSPLEKRDKDDLGRFGLGLKTASISQCRRVVVCSKKSGEMSACEWDLDYLAKNGSTDWLLKVCGAEAINKDKLLQGLKDEHLSAEESGTIVLWRVMDSILAGTEQIDSERKFSELMAYARDHLQSVFHRFLSPDPGQRSIHVYFNKSPLTAANPFGPAVNARQELPLEKVKIDGHAIEVQPYILPHENKVSRDDYEKYSGEGGYLHNQGFYVYRNRRLIVKSTWFRLIKKDELNKLVRVRIDIPNSIDDVWGINVDKSQVCPPEIVRKQLKKIIQKISGAGKQVYKRKSARLIDRHKVAVWKREASEGKVIYSVNIDHPMIKTLLDKVKPSQKEQIKTALSLIAQSFPTDVFYTDKANDDIEISLGEIDESAAADTCRELIRAYEKCGFSKDEIQKKLRGTEMPGISDEVLEDLLQNI